MTQQPFPQTDVYNRESLRTDLCDDLELCVAASEIETLCAGWLIDQRINTAIEGHGRIKDRSAAS